MKIEGFFSGIKNANEAVEKLKQAGYDSYADLNEHYMLNNNTRTRLPGNEGAPSLSDLVLRSGVPSDVTDKASLLAASPMVSGMGNFEEIADINYKVVVDTKDSDKQAVRKIIESVGGTLDSPNINIPDRIKDVNLKHIDEEDLSLGGPTDLGQTF